MNILFARTIVISVLGFGLAWEPTAQAVLLSNLWFNFSGSQEQCFATAAAALAALHYGQIDRVEETVFGVSGEYSSGIRCVAEKQIVFIFTAGPQGSIAAQLNDLLAHEFEQPSPEPPIEAPSQPPETDMPLPSPQQTPDPSVHQP